MSRRFLFLQGPHGPFLGQLADQLRAAGAEVIRVGFNAGDRAFWGARPGYVPWRGDDEAWISDVTGLLERMGITDVVVYGEERLRHASALEAARGIGVRTHILEEGYLRPYWITYEREGTNGRSPLMALSVDEMAEQLGKREDSLPDSPARWGDLAAHVRLGAAYHAALLAGRRWYPAYASHRSGTVGAEFRRYARRVIDMPLRRVRRRIATHRLMSEPAPYHLILLQLAHDSNFLHHGPFPDQSAFLDTVFHGFAEGAPSHHRLAIKAHPLEDGRLPLARLVRERAAAHGLTGRVTLIDGGKLAPLLDEATSVVTVNSTAGQQVLLRGLPLRIFGDAVYDKPELVSRQPLPHFFETPIRPDEDAYRIFRRFLLKTSQIPGGFYGTNSRRRLLRRLPDLMLAETDGYEALAQRPEAPRQHLAVLR